MKSELRKYELCCQSMFRIVKHLSQECHPQSSTRDIREGQIKQVKVIEYDVKRLELDY